MTRHPLERQVREIAAGITATDAELGVLQLLEGSEVDDQGKNGLEACIGVFDSILDYDPAQRRGALNELHVLDAVELRIADSSESMTDYIRRLREGAAEALEIGITEKNRTAVAEAANLFRTVSELQMAKQPSPL